MPIRPATQTRGPRARRKDAPWSKTEAALRRRIEQRYDASACSSSSPQEGVRMTRMLASLLVLGLVLVAPAFAADTTKTAKGTVKTVAADSLTVTDSAGKDWTFVVDTKTKGCASVGPHKTADTTAMGKVPEITDVVKTGASVTVKYHELEGGKMHAASVRVM